VRAVSQIVIETYDGDTGADLARIYPEVFEPCPDGSIAVRRGPGVTDVCIVRKDGTRQPCGRYPVSVRMLATAEARAILRRAEQRSML